jgi:hypothetical protein
MGTISTGAGSIACSITKSISSDARRRTAADRTGSRRQGEVPPHCAGMDHLRRFHWPTIRAKYDFPPEFVQSKCYFKSIFHLWRRIEPTEEEQQAFLTIAREVFLSLQ